MPHLRLHPSMSRFFSHCSCLGEKPIWHNAVWELNCSRVCPDRSITVRQPPGNASSQTTLCLGILALGMLKFGTGREGKVLLKSLWYPWMVQPEGHANPCKSCLRSLCPVILLHLSNCHWQGILTRDEQDGVDPMLGIGSLLDRSDPASFLI